MVARAIERTDKSGVKENMNFGTLSNCHMIVMELEVHKENESYSSACLMKAMLCYVDESLNYVFIIKVLLLGC